MTLLREFYPAPKQFLWRIVGFCVVVLILFIAPAIKNGEFSKLALPLGMVGLVITGAMLYLNFSKARPRLCLYVEGLEGEHGFLAWSDVDDLNYVDEGSDLQAMTLQLQLKHGGTLSEDLDDLDSSPREVFQQTLNAFREYRNAEG
ncbi:MAG: hypothetical protein ACE37I_12195 [Rubinisphaera brasiliensis]|uniref:hypothetical protein n=1 Tax=Rubinisphaera brasiliensis TaxID=119 RepID=UPI00391CC8DE